MTLSERERDWQRKLGRLRLGAEPLRDQLERYRRVTWALTVVPAILSLMFVALFAAFRAPLLGLGVAAVLLLPVVGFAWLDYWILKRKVIHYEVDQARQRENPAPGEERSIDRV